MSNLINQISNVINRLQALQGEASLNGTDVRYEVEFVGGTVPVDTPHLSTPYFAQDALKAMETLMHSFEFDELVVAAEEADEEYLRRYSEVVRDLDLVVHR